MKKKNRFRRSLSLALALALVLSLFQINGLTPGAAAASAGDYGVPYRASMRVDESIGLRADVQVSAGGNTVTGITPTDTRLTKELDVTNTDTTVVTAAPFVNYTTKDIVIAAFARITHQDGTVSAVKDVQTVTDTGALAAGYTYQIPDFTSHVKTDDQKVEVEITVYGDFTYTTPAVDYTLDLSNGTAKDAAGTAYAFPMGGQNNRTFLVDAATYHDKTILVTGTGTRDTNTLRQVYVFDSAKNAANRRVNLILDDAVMLPNTGMNMGNYKTHMLSENPYVSNIGMGMSNANRSTGGSLRTSNTTKPTTSPLTLSDVDAYVTLRGESIFAYANTYEDGGSNGSSGVTVDASASLIVTDASTGSLYARGGDCSAGIGTSDTSFPAGYVEIDGGTVEAISVNNSHSYSGIGNGGHYYSTDPGIRGIVVTGGTVNAFGYHYGLGGNGGTSGTIDATIGPMYVSLTGGNVVSEGSAGSMGASIGYAYNNNENQVRIGRPDKGNADSSVTSVNWGYGAAISGKMDFYSGTTKAYSGETAAAIGGCALSNASVSVIPPTIPNVINQNSAITGTDMNVYGGKLQAAAGVFTNYVYGQYSMEKARGTMPAGTAARTGPESIDAPSLWGSKGYGAAIGGAIGKAGGQNTNIFAGDFEVYSSLLGAGIGGGGAYIYSPSASRFVDGGAGGNTWVGSLTDLKTGQVAPMSFNVTSSRYGAGIGGGGSDGARTAGSGGNLFVGGGQFNVTSNGLGAAVGGGGSQSGTAGTAGNALFTGGTVQVKATQNGSVGVGGGNSVTGTSKTKEGTVIVTGGNIFTEIDATIDNTGVPGMPANMHAHVLPRPNTASPYGDMTTTATKIDIPGAAKPGNRDKVGDQVYQVAYSYQETDPATGGKVSSWHYDYGTNDMVVTPVSALDPSNTTDGQLWVWVPSNYHLDFDLTTGAEDTAAGYDKQDSHELAYGYLYAVMKDTASVYNSPGETKQLIQWDTLVDGTIFGGLYQNHTGAGDYADGTKQYYQLLTHPQDNGFDVAFVGWTKTPDTKIYAREESARPNLIKEVEFTNRDEKAYAVWGYDKNGNGIADIVEGQKHLYYDANTPAGGIDGTQPINSAGYLDGDLVPIAGKNPENTDSSAIFMGWTSTQEALLKAGDSMPAGTVYGRDTANGQVDQITMAGTRLDLYALWAADENGNGVPDFQETILQVNYHLNGGSGTAGPTKSVSGVTATLDSGAGLTAPVAGQIFLGWTLDSSVAPSYGKGDTLPQLETSVTFANANIDVYAVWGDDSNNNGTPDVYENTYTLQYDPSTTDTVTDLPVDSTQYLENEQVTALGTDIPKRTGWVFDHWTGTAPANAGDYDASTASQLANMPAAVTLPLTFGTSNLTVYAVWAVDKNNNGVPDWNDAGGLSVQYSPTLSTVDLGTMPFPYTDPATGSVKYLDNNGGAGYLTGDWTTTGQSGKTPEAPNRIFLGWSPVYVENFDFGSGDLQEFQTLLTFIQDVPAGSNNSGRNQVGATLVKYPQADYKTAQLDSALAACTTTGDWATAPYDWSTYQTGDGFLTDVRLPGFDSEMANFGGDWMLSLIHI